MTPVPKLWCYRCVMLWLVLLFILLPSSPSSGHTASTHRGKLQAASATEKIRIHRKSSGVQVTEDGEEVPPMTNSYAQAEDSAGDAPAHTSITAEVIATLKSRLNNPAITIVQEPQRSPSMGQSTMEFTFSLHHLPIEGYRVRAINRPNGDLMILGDIPLGDYDPALFADLQHLSPAPERLAELAHEGLAQFHQDVDPQLMELAGQYQCVISHEGELLPSLCLTIQYNTFTYYAAKITQDELLTIHPLGHHYCGILKNVHTKNVTDDPRSFSVSLCDPTGDKNVLANHKFVFASREPEHSSCSTPEEATSRRSDSSMIDGLLTSITAARNRTPSSLWSLDADPLSPWRVLNIPGTFTYAEDDSFAKRKIHLFSYLNRILNWFEALGFDPYETPLVIMITDKPPRESCIPKPSNASYVYYLSEIASSNPDTPPERTTLHILNFGFPNQICPTDPHRNQKAALNNIALDIDIAAHELSHYVIARWMPGTHDRKYGDGNHLGAIHEGLADYFTFAATGEDCLGETVKDSPCIRTAHPNFKYRDSMYTRLATRYNPPQIHQIGQLVSGMLWHVRSELSDPAKQRQFDQLVLYSLHYHSPQNVTYEDLIDALITADEDKAAGAFCASIYSSARKFGFLKRDRAKHLTTQRCSTSTATAFAATNNPPVQIGETETYRITNTHALECASKITEIEQLTGIMLTEAAEFTNGDPRQRRRTEVVASGCSNHESLRYIAHASPSGLPDSGAPHQPAPLQVWLIGMVLSIGLRRWLKGAAPAG